MNLSILLKRNKIRCFCGNILLYAIGGNHYAIATCSVHHSIQFIDSDDVHREVYVSEGKNNPYNGGISYSIVDVLKMKDLLSYKYMIRNVLKGRWT